MNKRIDGHVENDESDSTDAHEQRAMTFDVLQRIHGTTQELWLHNMSIGGNLDEIDISAYLHGLLHLPAPDRDSLAQAVNEMLDDFTRGPRAPFSTNESGTNTSPAILTTDPNG